MMSTYACKVPLVEFDICHRNGPIGYVPSPSRTVKITANPWRQGKRYWPDGAVCVRHTRLKEVLDSATLVQECPRLGGSISEKCDEAMPALLFNRSFER